MEYTNQGTMWHNTDKKNPVAQDFKGIMALEKDFVEQLLSEAKDGVVELKLSLWKDKRTVKGVEKHILATKVDTWKPETQAKDPWDE
jgi:hypothetical protein